MRIFMFFLAMLVPTQLLAQLSMIGGDIPTIAPQSVQQNVVVVFDDSGSMADYLRRTNLDKMTAAKESLSKVLTSLPQNTQLGIITLNGQWESDQWLVPFGLINAQSIKEKIEQLSPTGGTPLGGCIKAGCDVLLENRAKQRHGVYTLLIVTDGEASDQRLVDRYIPDIMTRGITVNAIGVGMSSDHTLATKVNNYRSANDPNQLVVALQATFAEVSYKDKTSADEDFKMLDSLPDNLPSKLIDSLLDSGNQPIGETPEVIIDDETGTVSVTPAVASESTSGLAIVFYSFVFIIAIIFGFFCLSAILKNF